MSEWPWWAWLILICVVVVVVAWVVIAVIGARAVRKISTGFDKHWNDDSPFGGRHG
jgi:hypothetical protein